MDTSENDIQRPDDLTPEAPGAVASPDAVDARRRRTSAGTARGKRSARIIVAVAVVVAFAALVAYGFRWVDANERVSEARDGVESAARLLDAAEENLLVVDEAVQADVSSEIATQAADALALVSSVATELAEATTMIEGAMPDLPEADLPLAGALLQSAEARSVMMEEAPAILEADITAAHAIALADKALEAIKAAEALSVQATAEFNKHTEAGVRASSDASVRAETHLTEARSLLASTTAEFAGADYSAFTAYVDARIALVGISKEIDQLWLASKIEESNTRLTAYNARDAEAVAMAKALPGSVRDPIADAYKAATDESVARYFGAREKARVAGDRVQEIRDAVAADKG